MTSHAPNINNLWCSKFRRLFQMNSNENYWMCFQLMFWNKYFYSIENCGRGCHVLMEESRNGMRAISPISELAVKQLSDRQVRVCFRCLLPKTLDIFFLAFEPEVITCKMSSKVVLVTLSILVLVSSFSSVFMKFPAVDVKLKMEQWTEQAALASVNCLACFYISGTASTVSTLCTF